MGILKGGIGVSAADINIGGGRQVDGVVVRPAQAGDVQALVELLTQLHPAYPPDPKCAGATLDEVKRQPGRTLLVATLGDRVVGTTDLLIVPQLTHGCHPWAIVENVVVDQLTRGGGVGRAMISEVLRRADEAGCYMVQLVSLRHRLDAHAFYEGLGFVAVAEGLRSYFPGFAPTGDTDEGAASDTDRHIL
jgi:GNAT superfamily N-acetyltransferase